MFEYYDFKHRLHTAGLHSWRHPEPAQDSKSQMFEHLVVWYVAHGGCPGVPVHGVARWMRQPLPGTRIRNTTAEYPPKAGYRLDVNSNAQEQQSTSAPDKFRYLAN